MFFSGLKSLLKLIFASTAGPANLDFEATLWHFLRFLRFPENRIEDDFEVIFDLPKSPKKHSEIEQKRNRNREKINIEKHIYF